MLKQSIDHDEVFLYEKFFWEGKPQLTMLTIMAVVLNCVLMYQTAAENGLKLFV